MSITTTVDSPRTVIHAASMGISTAFPDVCKTPSPGGPVPIPYPNVGRSGDTSQGSEHVTVDGKPIMLKDSTFSTSTGDEAGTAGGGMLSSKTKGTAKFANYAFNTKVEGSPVPRMLDPMQQNGNASNAFSPAVMQQAVVLTPQNIIVLECDPNWDPCQKAQARAKVDALNKQAPLQRRSVNQRLVEAKEAWQKKYRRDYLKPAPKRWPDFCNPAKQPSQYYDPCAQTNGKPVDADHIVDSQWGGNVKGPFRMLDAAVNQSLGSQMKWGPNKGIQRANGFHLHCP